MSMSVRRYVASSDSGWARQARALRRGVRGFTLPVPHAVARALLAVFVALRACWHFFLRVFICEPLFKAYCTSYGRGVRTDIYVHWVQGRGDLIVGDDVLVDGKSSFNFASRAIGGAPGERPRLTIGSHTGLGHGCTITVARRVTIGDHCRIAAGTWIFDSSGHPADPVRRQAGEPPNADDIKPVTIQDNVWIGGRSIIFPGVTVGEGSIVSAGAVVTMDVPPYTVVAGNPARRIGALTAPAAPSISTAAAASAAPDLS
jgi:acetyltransferase-like isoleucine patch superfamily enzyme